MATKILLLLKDLLKLGFGFLRGNEVFLFLLVLLFQHARLSYFLESEVLLLSFIIFAIVMFSKFRVKIRRFASGCASLLGA